MLRPVELTAEYEQAHRRAFEEEKAAIPCITGTLTRLIPAEFCNSSAIFAVAGFGLAFGLIYRIYQFEKTEVRTLAENQTLHFPQTYRHCLVGFQSEGKASEGAGEDDPEKRGRVKARLCFRRRVTPHTVTKLIDRVGRSVWPQ